MILYTSVFSTDSRIVIPTTEGGWEESVNQLLSSGLALGQYIVSAQ